MLNRLFEFLLHHLIFGSTLFFAASAVGDVGAGTGAGDGAGVGESGGREGSSGTDSQDGSGGTDGTQSEEAGAGEGSELSDGQQTDPEAPVDLGNGRTVPAKWKKIFDQAKAAGGAQLEKDLRILYFGQQRLAKAIPGGVNAAIELAQAVEQFGGVEGIEGLQSDLDTYHEDSELFERGDPRWMETGFEENPDASLKHFNNALGIVADKFPEHYDHVMGKVVDDTLRQANLSFGELQNSGITAVYGALAAMKDNPHAQAAAHLLSRLYHLAKGSEELSRKVPEKKVDAQHKALSDREAKIHEREMGTRYRQVDAEAFPVMQGLLAKGLQAEAKLKGLDLAKLAAEFPAEFRAMKNEVQRRLQERAIQDMNFVNKYAALANKGDLKRAAAVVNAKNTKIFEDGLVAEVAADYGFMRGAKKVNANQNQNQNRGGNQDAANQNAAAGWSQVREKPAQHSIDYRKTTQSMQLEGQYILKDGKRVQVKY